MSQLEEALGFIHNHLSPVNDQGNHKLHSKVLEAFYALVLAAKKDGIVIKIASSYRDFSRQQMIWQNKYNGTRDVLDRNGQKVEITGLTDIEKVSAILNYSAFPGFSRHHWGTDLDIFDSAAIDEHYQLQLVPEEYSQSGPFYKLYKWLTNNADKFGFYLPYEHSGAFAFEPWHLSHASESKKYSCCLGENVQEVANLLESQNILGWKEIKTNLPFYIDNYVVQYQKAII